VKGNVATFGNQLWVITKTGILRGIWTEQHLPEVLALTWGLGKPGAAVPNSWTTAMSDGTTFTLGRCLDNNICHWVPFVESNNHVRAIRKSISGSVSRDQKVVVHHGHSSHKRSEQFIDPCSKYGDCPSCIRALDYCGWCSSFVLYNGSILGSNCGGLNKTLIPGLVCPGIFSTADCNNVPTRPPTVAPAPTVPPGPLYVCQPQTQQCIPTNPNNSSGGMPIDF